ncbi:MAG: cache domain-containing protein [Pseudomonadota bacterium]
MSESPLGAAGHSATPPLSRVGAAQVGFVVALSALVAAALWAYAARQQHIDLEALATLHAREIDSQLVRLAELPTVLSGDPRLVGTLEQPTPQATDQANTLLSRVQQQTDIEHAFLMDRSGLTVASSNHATPHSFIGRNYGFRPYFADAMAGRRGTQYAVGATTGEPGYFVSQPVLGGSRVIGALVFKLSLSHLADIWSARAEDTVLVDDAGITILASDPALLYRTTRSLSTDAVRTLQQVRHYPITTQAEPDVHWQAGRANWRGNRYFAASAQLETEDWRVGVLQAQQHVLGSVVRDFISVMALLSLLLLLMRDWWRQRNLANAEQHHARYLTQQVEAQSRELERAQRALIENSNLAALGRMSSAINHEVNQPLASLRLNLASLHTLLDKPGGNHDEMVRTVRDCERTTKRISRVVTALRTLARPGDTRFTEIGVTDLVADVVDTLRREQSPVADLVSTHGDVGVQRVNGNPVLLQQALLNLLHNAETAVADTAAPCVTLTATVTDGWVELAVEDNGPGVGADLSDALFEPFVQGQDNTRGLGLGLALARQIAFHHHGRLSHERTPEHTTRFALRLPLDAADTP